MTAVAKTDVIVIGGGLFGSIIAQALMFECDLEVLMIDDQRPLSGSLAAGCVMKPSWLSKLGSQFAPSMDLLGKLFPTFAEREFQMGALGVTKGVKCFWVDPGEVMTGRWHTDPARAIAIDHHQVLWEEGGELLPTEAPLIVVAAGVWTPALLPELKGRVAPQYGASYKAPGRLAADFIRPWAPYKQIVGVNFDRDIWIGDGRALVRDPENWKESRERCALALQYERGLLTETVGVRPYAHTTQPALLEQVRPGVWAATGGAKNGTAAGAWCALKLMELYK